MSIALIAIFQFQKHCLKMNKKIISNNIPATGKNLVKYRGIELIDRLGKDVILDVVTSILSGGNVRAMTEKLTQRRISMSNASMLMTFLTTSSQGHNIDTLYDQINAELINHKLTIEEKNYLYWIIGLTGKSIQNVLRGDKNNLKPYLDELSESINASETKLSEEFGGLNGKLIIDGSILDMSWKRFLQLSLAIGAQTLALRGAEKSMYGKFFEKLILGSVLSILGFQHTLNNDTSKKSMIFWLSQRGSKRESDATLLYKPGKGIRFDIGFIGVGNTEISLDKVSRFEREMEWGRELHYMKTIVLIDRIGEGSRIVEMAKNIDGSIIQMSMNYWVYEIAETIEKSIGYRHEILNLPKEKSIEYIELKMKAIDLKKFIEGIIVSEDEESPEEE
jgi:hypothetical protein